MEDDEEDEIDVIGRDSELQTLRKVLDRLVQNRTGSITIIEGEAGMGKSTLLRFVANTLSDLNGGYFSYFAQGTLMVWLLIPLALLVCFLSLMRTDIVRSCHRLR